MKKIISAALCVIMTVSLLAGSAFAEAGMGNFTKSNVYKTGRFVDVTAGNWFNESVGASYEYKLLLGVSANEFGATQNVTLAEVLTMAARLHSIYNTGKENIPITTPWYKGYADYCITNGIISSGRFENYEVNATRYQVAEVLAMALPATALAAINTVEEGAIPDLDQNEVNSHIYLLYRAGILTGNSEAGEFCPKKNILRSEMAAIITRMAAPSLRKSFTLQKYNSEGKITSKAQMTEALETAQHTVADAYKNTAQAIAMLTSGVPLTVATGASLKMSSAEEIVLAATHLQNVMDFCKDKAEYAEVYKNAEQAKNCCTEAAKCVTQLTANPPVPAQNMALSLIEGAGTATAKALGE